MEDCYLMWYFKKLSALMQRRGREHMMESGITLNIRQSYVLDYLFAHRDQHICATDMHEQVGISKASISGVLKSLKQEGLVRYEENPLDDRKKWIVVTQKALDIKQQIDKGVAEEQRCMCQGIPPEQLQTVKECLEIMIKNLKTETARRNQHDKDIIKAGKTI